MKASAMRAPIGRESTRPPGTGEPAASATECAQAGTTPAEQWNRAAHANVAAMTFGLSPVSLALAMLDWGAHLAVSPGTCFELATQAWLAAVVPAANRGAGEADDMDTSGLAVHAGQADPRFAAPAWAGWPFRAYRDGFLSIQRWWRDATRGVPGVERHHEELVGFAARQWLDACSPGNFLATNPVVLDATMRSGGANLAAGFRHWLDDATAWLDRANGTRSRDARTYLPGRDVAITPGRVVWRNALCELLQYDPTTADAAREPIVIVPSWIMKYYILDLQPHDSLIRFLVDSGYTVFAVSWRNPGADARALGLDDYLRDGCMAALDAARSICGEAVHAVGYCLGGTLLAIGAAALARDGRQHEALRSVTLLAAQTDFSEPGELGLFIDASELSALDALMWRQGYLDGAQMSAAFELLNARDLIWSRMMSEYLLGKRTKPNDLMSWNADTTRMPYRMHTEYLTRLFLDNDLAAGRYCVDGRPVALSDIDVPTFMVGTERDHVSPWHSVYKLHLLTHHALTFVLTSGGHNAGIVAEPGHPGRHYRCATREPGAPYRSRHDFVSDTPVVDGSWWTCWRDWLRAHSSGDVPARVPAAGFAAAPGTYVLET